MFDENVKVWQSENVAATEQNKKSAIEFIKAAKGRSGTNLSKPIETAFQTKEGLEGIYLLSDGFPNAGIQSVDAFKEFIVKGIETRKANKLPPVRIIATNFMLGGTESKAEREKAGQFLQAAAEVSNGIYKKFDN